MSTTILPDGASGGVTDRYGPPSGAIVAVDKYKYKYLIAIAVTLAAVLELIDTSIVNVAIPHMMGNLGATSAGSAISPARSCCSSPPRSSAAPRARWAA